MPTNFWQELWDIFKGPLQQVLQAAAACAALVFAYWGAKFMAARKSLTDSQRADVVAKDVVVAVDREYVAPRKDPATPEPFDATAKIAAHNMAVARVMSRVPDLQAAEASDKVERAVKELQVAGTISAPVPADAVAKPPSNPPGPAGDSVPPAAGSNL